MESMTARCLLCDCDGCREQAERQLQAKVKPVTQGEVMLRAAGTRPCAGCG